MRNVERGLSTPPRRRPFRHLVALLALAITICWPAEASATLIVVVRTANQIIIAADSLRVWRTEPPKRDHMCKIHDFGDMVFAAYGRSYDRGPTSIAAITEGLSKTIVPAGDRAADLDHRVSDAFGSYFRELPPSATAIFGYALVLSHEGDLSVYDREIVVESGSVTSGKRRYLDTDMLSFSAQADVVDHLDEIDLAAFFRGVRSMQEAIERLEEDPVTLLEAVINYQAERKPNMVGGPVAVLRMTADGTEWLRRGACD